MRWVLSEPAPQDFLYQGGASSPLIQQLLWNRSLKDLEEVDAFLHPDWKRGILDPFLFRDMEKGTARILHAIDHKDHIKIIADYDADGITAGTILYETLEMLGAQDISIYIPNRFTEGYGIQPQTIDECVGEGVKLIITVDVGITALEALAKARGYSIDVIICDHHHPVVDDRHACRLPEAYAILHPDLPGETYPSKHLSGVGVTYKLVQGLLRKSKISARGGSASRGKNQKSKLRNDLSYDSFEKWLLDLVAIGTVADIVPLLGENRILVKYGLIVLNKTKRTGLRELIIRVGLRLGTMQEESRALSTHNIGWQIAPRLNAASRMEHGVLAFQLLSEKDGQKAKALAEKLDQANSERQGLTNKILEEARVLLEREEQAAVLASTDWPSTVCGLVAGRLADEFFMPVFLFEQRDEMYEGSGRSVDGIDIMEVLDECKDCLYSYGGHPMACGLKIQGIERFKKFKEFVRESVKKRIPKGFEKSLHIESVLPFSEITQDFVDQLKAFEPFGEGNPKPLFWFQNCRIVQVTRVGGQGNHVKFLCSQGDRMMKAMKFHVNSSRYALSEAERNRRVSLQNSENGSPSTSSGTNIWDILKEGDTVDLAGVIEESVWNGMREVFITIQDIRRREEV